MKDPRSSLKLLLASGALGWGIALYSLIHRQRLFLEGLDGKSFCHVGEAFNCDAAALSDFSSTFGLPTAALGMAFYAVIFILGIWTYFAAQDGQREKTSTGTTLLFVISAVALLPTAYLALKLLTVVRTICLMCLANYAANAAIFFTAWKSMRNASGKSFAWPRPGLVPGALWITFTVVIAASLFAPNIVNSSIGGGTSGDSGMVNALVARHLQSPVQNVRVDDSPAIGPKGAIVTIVEFSDFQCPYCRRAALTLPQVAAAYGDQVRIVFKNFPLNASCNPSMKGGGGHPFACEAAKTGRCVFKLRGDEAFFAYADEIFENQTTLTNDFIAKVALDRGIVPETLKECLADFSTHQAVLDEAREAEALGVSATPTLFVNGRMAEGAISPTILKPILDSYLRK